MKSGRKWETKQLEFLKQNGEIMTNAEIKDKWARAGEIARKRGTYMHWLIEMFLNGAVIHGPFSVEFDLFLQFYQRTMYSRRLIPVRTEMSIFHCGLICAGQVDLLAKYEDTSEYVIIDWKRCKQINRDACGNVLSAPFEHLPRTNWSTYSLQLNIYRYILQTEYNLRVAELYLAIFHPSRRAPEVLSVPLMDYEMDLLVAHEIEVHGCGQADPADDALFPYACFIA